MRETGMNVTVLSCRLYHSSSRVFYQVRISLCFPTKLKLIVLSERLKEGIVDVCYYAAWFNVIALFFDHLGMIRFKLHVLYM